MTKIQVLVGTCFAFFIAFLLLAAASVALSNKVAALTDRTQHFESRLRAAEKKMTERKRVVPDPSGRFEKIEERLESAEAETAWNKSRTAEAVARMDTLTSNVEGVRKQVVEVKKAVAESTVENRSVPVPSNIEELVQDRVDKKVREELTKAKLGGEWKPSMEELAAELELTATQSASAKDVFNRVKDEAIELLTTPRMDGTNMMDDFVDAVVSGNPEEEMKKIFRRLFTEKIPGKEQTYLAELMVITDGAKKEMSTFFMPEQSEQLEALNLDFLDVKTGYDPFAEYVEDALAE